jgi:hypothetical protein
MVGLGPTIHEFRPARSHCCSKLVDGRAKHDNDGKRKTSSEAQITKNERDDYHDANDVEDIHPDSPQNGCKPARRQTCRFL